MHPSPTTVILPPPPGTVNNKQETQSCRQRGFPAYRSARPARMPSLDVTYVVGLHLREAVTVGKHCCKPTTGSPAPYGSTLTGGGGWGTRAVRILREHPH